MNKLQIILKEPNFLLLSLLRRKPLSYLNDEKYMVDQKNNDLIDYKFKVFNGKVQCIFVATNGNTDNPLTYNYMDRNWNRLPFNKVNQNHSDELEKPINFEKMIYYAEKLSENCPYLRVDFYEVDGKIFLVN